MKIAVMGAGALGCYFGGRLAQAGVETAFIARGAQLKALQQTGLHIESPLGDAHLTPVTATGDPATIGPVDLVLFLVKLYDTESAARQIAPLLGRDTAVVSFQNGIDAWSRIGVIVGAERVIGGTAYIPAHIKAPGIVSHNGPFARLTFGEFDGRESERCRDLSDTLQSAGVDQEMVLDIDVKIWKKFIVLSALSAATALTRLPIGKIRDDPLCRQFLESTVEETHRVGKAVCHGLGADEGAKALALLDSFPQTMRASMLDDLERGKRLELDDLSGAVVRLGAAHGIATPVHSLVQQALHPYVDGGGLA